MSNNNLNKAQNAKNDEFYTNLFDIENELKNYKNEFKGKTILMPCDDPELFSSFKFDNENQNASKFWVYFHLHFKFLGLKKIIATHFSEKGDAYIIEYTGGKDEDIKKLIKKPLKGDGDFRSDEIKKIINKSDLVITNPPFSLFRVFVEQLIEFEKKFIIIGPEGVMTYKDFFPLIKENKVWTGYTKVKEFITVGETGEMKTKKFGNVCWWTNIETTKRTNGLFLFKKYSKKDYDNVETYEAIMVNKVKDIPVDYNGIMAVPGSYLNYHNPANFEIVGFDQLGGIPATYVNGKKKYRRMLIRRK